MSQKKFQKTAKKGNKKLLQATNKLGWTTTLATDEYSVYDALITTSNNIYLAETKHRAKRYDDMILEEKKMLAMAKVAKGTDKRLMYINTFDNGTALVWVIDKELIEASESKVMKCPKTSAIKGKWIDKTVYLLPVDKAIEIEN